MYKPSFYSVLLILFACLLFTASYPISDFDKKGVSFSLASDWEISDERPLGQEGYTLTCEKSGIESSGVFILTWFEERLDLDTLIDTYTNQMSEDEELQKGNFQRSLISDNWVGKYSTRSLKYKADIMGESYQGEIHTFYGKNRTLILHLHEADIDSLENYPSFNLMRSTLDCEGAFTP